MWVIGHSKYLRRYKKPFWKAGIQVYLLNLVHFLAPGSRSAFTIQIQIQDPRFLLSCYLAPRSAFRGHQTQRLSPPPSLSPFSLCSRQDEHVLSGREGVVETKQKSCGSLLLFYSTVPVVKRLRNRIRNPVLFLPLDANWEKNPDSRSGINIPEYISDSLSFFGVNNT